MTSVIVTSLVGLFCSIITAVVTFTLTKKKYNTEVESQQIQNVNNSFGVYKAMMEETLELQNKKIEILEKENENLKQQISELRNQVFELMKTQLDEAAATTKKKSSKKQ